MSKHHLEQHYHQLKDHFQRSFQLTRERQDIEDIHQLRVSIKRLRAYWAFVEMASRRQFRKKDHYRLYHSLFKKAGKVREAQVNLQLIKGNKARYLLPYAEHLRSIQQKEAARLRREMERFPPETAQSLDCTLLATVAGLDDSRVLHDSAVFVLQRFRMVRQLQQKLPSDRYLHQIRIQLKTVDAILTIMREIKSTGGLTRLQGRVKTLNKALGKWHDYVELIASLQDFNSPDRPEREQRFLQKLTFRLAYQQTGRQEKIHRRLDHFFLEQGMKPLEKWR